MERTTRSLPFTHDVEADAAYLSLRDRIAPGGVARTVRVALPGDIAAMINLDFDADGRLLGVEVIGAAATLPEELLS